MKLSRKFISDYVNIPDSSKDFAEKMTKVGNEYESIESLIKATNLIIGHVIECKNHPDSDHLHVCLVDIGKENLQIVCGAPNVKEGIKVIVAQNGAELPGGTIKKCTIRGVESNGMICSIAELGLESKYLSESDKEGIHVLDNDAIIGEDPAQYLGLDDEVIDFELTANRADLLSILGMSYEAAAIYNESVKEIDISYTETKEEIAKSFEIDIKTETCPLFLAKKVTNIIIEESPKFIKTRLMASGIRPINNVVDISNYVMLETGQPLHFYDADKLGNKLVVRLGNDKEELITLDNQKRTIAESDIVIANDKEAVGLAGVMGGLSTEITEQTKNIIIESAIFDPVLIRRTSKKILRSEASNRFEKGIDPKRTYMALNRACHLLEKYANASIVSGLLEHNKINMDDKTIIITLNDIRLCLGFNIELSDVINVFDKLGFITDVDDDTLSVIVPSRRTDISIKEDLIEEVGRIYGVDNIKGTLPFVEIKEGSLIKLTRNIRNKMVSLGLNEVMTYTLVPEAEVKKYTTDTFDIEKLLDPMSEDKSTLRYSLIPSLLSVYDYNTRRGNKDITIFEIGRGFYKIKDDYYEDNKIASVLAGNYFTGLGTNNKIDFYITKGIVEELLNYLGYENRYSYDTTNLPNELHPYQSTNIIVNKEVIGTFGRIHPNIYKEDIYMIEINLTKLLNNKVGKMKYKEVTKYPGITKDLAFILDNEVVANEVTKTITASGGKLLKSVTIFDLYKGDKLSENKKSIAFKLTFESFEKTLTEDEIKESLNKIVESVSSKHEGVLRDN